MFLDGKGPNFLNPDLDAFRASTPQDSPEAVATGTTPWYEKAAAAGEPDALYNLGIQHELGLHGQEPELCSKVDARVNSPLLVGLRVQDSVF